MNGIVRKYKLRRIVRYAAKYSKFYKEKYNKIDFRKLRLDTLPIIEQEELIDKSIQFCTEKGIYKMVSSSGTRGNPKYLFRTKKDFSISVKNQIKMMEKCNVDRYSKIAIIQPSGIWGYSSIIEQAIKKMGGFYVQMGDLSDEMCLILIYNLEIDVIDIAPSRLYRLLERDSSKFQCKMLSRVKIIMCSGEKLESDILKEFVKHYNFHIYEQYGSEELDGLAWKNYSDGKYYFFDDFLVEVINSSGRNAELGRIVITSLYHKGTPLIRYCLGDIVKRDGKGYQIIGRDDYTVNLYDSVKLSTYQIETMLKKINMQKYIECYQVFIEDDGNYIVVSMIIGVSDLSENEERIIISEMIQLSIDIEKLYYDNKVKFYVRHGIDEILINMRGKKSKIIDLRNNENRRDFIE